MCFYSRFKKISCGHEWETWVQCANTKSLVNTLSQTILNKRGEEHLFPLRLCEDLEDSAGNLGWQLARTINIPGNLVSEKFSNIWCPKCHLNDQCFQHGWVCCVCSFHNTQPLAFCQNSECFAQRIQGSSRSWLATSHVLCKRCLPGPSGRNLRSRCRRDNEDSEDTLQNREDSEDTRRNSQDLYRNQGPGRRRKGSRHSDKTGRRYRKILKRQATKKSKSQPTGLRHPLQQMHLPM